MDRLIYTKDRLGELKACVLRVGIARVRSELQRATRADVQAMLAKRLAAMRAALDDF